jgi:hypothetical protein
LKFFAAFVQAELASDNVGTNAKIIAAQRLVCF